MAPRRGTPNRVVSWRGTSAQARLVSAPAIRHETGTTAAIRHVAAGARAVWTVIGGKPARDPATLPDRQRKGALLLRQRALQPSHRAFAGADGYHPVGFTARGGTRTTRRRSARRRGLLRAPAVRLIGRGPEAGALRALADQLAGDGRARRAVAHRSTSCSSPTVPPVQLVCPSRFEGLGVTPLESAALGVPTVASDDTDSSRVCRRPCHVGAAG